MIRVSYDFTMCSVLHRVLLMAAAHILWAADSRRVVLRRGLVDFKYNSCVALAPLNWSVEVGPPDITNSNMICAWICVQCG